MTQEEYSEMLSQAKDQFKSGKPLFGKDGAFHQVLEDFLNAAMDGEMDSHLESEKCSGKSNRRNGKMSKEVQTEYGPVEVSTPRDREGSFSPETIKKRQTILAEGLSDKIISLYATGQSVRDISQFLEENYGNSISSETISNITDKVWPEIKAWRTRSLESVYAIVWMDAIHYKVRDDSGSTVSRAIYNVIDISKDGHKDLLGITLGRAKPFAADVDAGKPMLPQLMRYLYDNRVQSLIVEGGAKTHSTFLESGLWDEIRVETCPRIITSGTRAAALPADIEIRRQRNVDGNIITEYVKAI